MTPPTPSPLPRNLWVDAECGDVSDLYTTIARTAAKMKNGTALIADVDTGRRFYLTREPGGVFTLATTKGPLPPRTKQADIKTAGPLLWKILEAGADTPEGRVALARGMMGLLPCGGCKDHWALALKGLTDAATATAESFDRWQWNEHNAVNERTGKPFFSWEEYHAQKKK